LLFALLCTAPR